MSEVPLYGLDALDRLIEALFFIRKIEDVTPLVLRLPEAATGVPRS